MKGYFKSMDHNARVTYRKPLGSCDEYAQMDEPRLNNYYKEMSQNYKFQMDQTVNEPALFALNNIKFTSIAVDPASANNNFNDVIFVGLEDGRVIKLLVRPVKFESKKERKYQQPIIVQEYHIFTSPVTSLLINNITNKLIAISDEEIKSIQLDGTCSSYGASCAECVESQDPYCVWSVGQSKCTSSVLAANTDE